MESHVAGSHDADLPRIIDHKRLLQSDWPAVHSAWRHNFGVCFSPDALPRSAKGAGLQTSWRSPAGGLGMCLGSRTHLSQCELQKPSKNHIQLKVTHYQTTDTTGRRVTCGQRSLISDYRRGSLSCWLWSLLSMCLLHVLQAVAGAILGFN